jgi:hypothetical protein
MTTLQTPFVAQSEDAMFELSVAGDGIEESYRHHAVGKQDIADTMMAPRTFLPRRSGEPRFAPRQFFYQASKTGVVPSWRFAM